MPDARSETFIPEDRDTLSSSYLHRKENSEGTQGFELWVAPTLSDFKPTEVLTALSGRSSSCIPLGALLNDTSNASAVPSLQEKFSWLKTCVPLLWKDVSFELVCRSGGVNIMSGSDVLRDSKRVGSN